MFYEFSFTIPAGTPISAPVKKELKLTHGIAHHVIIEAAPGCKRYAAVRILQCEHQVIPTNPDEDVALNSVPREFDERIELLEPPYTLTVIGYSPNADNDHTYRIGIGVLPLESFIEYSGNTSALDKFLKLVGVK